MASLEVQLRSEPEWGPCACEITHCQRRNINFVIPLIQLAVRSGSAADDRTLRRASLAVSPISCECSPYLRLPSRM